MSLITEIIEPRKDYTWQLRANNYTCTFTTRYIQEAYNRMRKVSAERKNEEVRLFLFKETYWLKFSSSEIYKHCLI